MNPPKSGKNLLRVKKAPVEGIEPSQIPPQLPGVAQRVMSSCDVEWMEGGVSLRLVLEISLLCRLAVLALPTIFVYAGLSGPMHKSVR